MNKVLNFLYSIFLSILVIILCINCVLRFRQLYYFDIDYLNIENTCNLSKSEIIKNYDYLIDYNLGKKEGEFNMPSIKSSKEGKIHFEEVKNIFDRLKQIFVVCSLVVILGFYKNKKQNNKKILLYSSILLFCFPVILFVPVVFGFDKSFIVFHKIFFRNDYWIFDPKLDPVINILPAEFFMHCGIMIIGLIFLSSVGMYIVYKEA